MRSRLFSRLAQVAIGVVLLGAFGAGLAATAVGPEPGARRQARRGFSLYADVFTLFLVNRVACGVDNLGQICTDPGNSPIGGGGFWPKGTPDQYIFNSGSQVAGIIAADAGFEWAGDTVGVYFMDPRGSQGAGDGVTQVFSSLDPDDAANWPNGAVVRDAAIYNSVLLGRDNISQQDLWVRAWDGNPNLQSGRTHPMGILVETRGLAWNFPSGNEDIVYFVMTLTNISASDASAYSGLDPAIQGEIAAIGQQYQAGVQSVLGVDIPAAGYAIDDVYAAFFMDPDVGDFSNNYSTAVLPFNLAVAYKADYLEPSWDFPADIFGTPFARAPGFVGVKYLRSPVNPATGLEVGLTIFSNTNNSSTGFPDPVGVVQLWRYLSGNVSAAAGDNTCTVSNPQARQLCYLEQDAVDTRFYQSSGPFTLEAGQAVTIVVAYVHAAPVASAVASFIGGDMKPGIPGSGSRLALPSGAANRDTLRNIDRAVGWVGPAVDVDGDGIVEQEEVQTLPRSLLNKALIAQAVFDNQFLLPFAPAPPNFFLVPGANQVTVVWEPSATEALGDPFFVVANDVTSPLFDPNFRQNDVEGYRIYRGRTPSALQLVAQFDYVGTAFIDNNAAINYGNCAPELGVTTDCPVDFATETNTVELAGDVVQVAPGARAVLLDGVTVITLSADTAVTGGGATFPPMTNTGVPFAFIDNSVLNGFTYFYAVTAFDVNSVASGPTSLESARVTQSAMPRPPSPQVAQGVLAAPVLLGADDSELDTDAPLPTLDPATGIFSGSMPPANGLVFGLAAFVPELVQAGDVTLTVDSIVPGSAIDGEPLTYFFTGTGASDTAAFAMTFVQDAFGLDASVSTSFRAITVDTAAVSPFGTPGNFSLAGLVDLSVPGAYRVTKFGRADINGDPSNSVQTSPRWWSGAANETQTEPNSTVCTPSSGGCVQVDLSHTAGELPGVDVLFHLQSYATVPNAPQRNLEALTAGVTRAADINVYWGGGGAIDSVIDITHRVPVQFNSVLRASWGILNASGFAGTTEASTDDGVNARLTWADVFCIAPAPAELGECGSTAQTPAVLSQTAELSPINAESASFSNTATLAAGAATGNGFILYLNGHFFLMQMTALPAAGTVWSSRFFAGNIVGQAADDDYTFQPAIRPPAVPGLRYRISYTGSTLNSAITTDDQLASVHTVPDPYYVTSSLENTANRKVLNFVNVPAQAIIRIYSVSGVLVNVIEHNDQNGGGQVTWNLRNRNNQFVASGVYFYHVETADGREKVGRFTVVNFAQ